MTVLALEIPDDPADLPAWLDGHLVGPDLSALVAELEAIHGGDAPADSTIRGALGPDLDAVLRRGLGAAPRLLLARLLRRPRLLLDLQELVLTEGGPHWDRLATRGSPPNMGTISLPTQTGTSRRGLLWATGLALAAGVLLASLAVGRPRPWGWERPGAIDDSLPRAAYLDRLADAAGEWFDARPATASALERRLVAYRRGCSRLIAAPHRALPAADRAWLVAKCRAWDAKLGGQLASAREGRDPGAVLKEADATVRSLVEALRARARAVTDEV